MDISHSGIDKAASSWTPCGWTPSWTLAAVTLRGLKSPLTWMYDNTTYQNHTKYTRVNFFAFDILELYSFLRVQSLYFLLPYLLISMCRVN